MHTIPDMIDDRLEVTAGQQEILVGEATNIKNQTSQSFGKQPKSNKIEASIVTGSGMENQSQINQFSQSKDLNQAINQVQDQIRKAE